MERVDLAALWAYNLMSVAGLKQVVQASIIGGKPRLKLRDGRTVDYVSGSGSDVLIFKLPPDAAGDAAAVDLNGGAIIASEASAALRAADVSLPK